MDRLSAIKRANALLKNSLKSCSICPRKCKVDRTKDVKGYCRAGLNPVVYSYAPHHGEEPPLSGKHGSGTIFFSHCNMKCVYCQNYYFSQLDNGEDISIEKLAEIMLYLEKARCHNINLVSPTHYVPQILMALEIASQKGLTIPIVYNTSGYDLPETIKLLEGVIDIYMPDMRYSDNDMAKRYSDSTDYVGYNRASVKEMWRQVGDLATDKEEIAKRGLIIRLLALPNDVSGTKESLKYIRENTSLNTYLSIMSQYYPTFKAYDYKELSTGVARGEYKNIVDEAKRLGLNNGWVQEGPARLSEASSAAGGPAEPDTRFYGTNIKPKTKVKDD